MKKNLLLTFDYELYLGQKSGTVDNCLIRPTKRILEILKANNAKAVFFIDTSYLYRLEEIGKTNPLATQDFNKIKEQLVLMVKEGHYLFHHIHPHWLDAQYHEDINQWSLSNTNRFAIPCLNDNEKGVLFSYSDKFLSEIIIMAGSSNKPNGYRAGGLFIEPFSCFKPYFESFNIIHDFSVSPKEKIDGDKFGYDFTKCPTDRFYSFNDDITAEDSNGKFIEFPISSIKIMGVTKICNSLYYRLYLKKGRDCQLGDGLSVAKVVGISMPLKPIKNYFIAELGLSIEMLNIVLLPLYKRTIKQRQYIHFLSHPKLQTVESLRMMNKLLRFCNKNFECEYDFARFDKL
ncbi:MAG TPA: hypothetical protein PLB59_01425 [Bacteroidales bacterium]|nr:hypothetical protein [Bacteroidales bacterium]HQP14603.1 hypothetical protein [Bacteroidales bacterium]